MESESCYTYLKLCILAVHRIHLDLVDEHFLGQIYCHLGGASTGHEVVVVASAECLVEQVVQEIRRSTVWIRAPMPICCIAVVDVLIDWNLLRGKPSLFSVHLYFIGLQEIPFMPWSKKWKNGLNNEINNTSSWIKHINAYYYFVPHNLNISY